MFNKILICLLLIFGYAYAENGWSEPMLLSDYNSDVGAYPYITIDNYGNLYAFWTVYPNNVFYRVSRYNGQSWDNIDSTSVSQEDQPVVPKVVWDSNNDPHLFYTHMYGANLIYQKRENWLWNQPQIVINDVAGSSIVIDKNNNIYVFWGRGVSHTFYKILYANGSWSAEKVINDQLILDVCTDGTQFLHLASCSDTYARPVNYKAYYLKYSIAQDSIVETTDLSNNMHPTETVAIACSQGSNQQVFTALNVGNYGDTASTWYCKQQNNSWQPAEKLKMKTFTWDKQIVVDSGNNPHLFDISLNRDTLFHFSKTATGWETKNVICTPTGVRYWIGGYKALIDNDNIYLVYNWGVNGQKHKIYFTKKKITVGIEDNGQLTIDNVQLKNYPNPFNNNTQISFVLPLVSNVKLEVFNAKGEQVRTLVNSQLKSGMHSYNFNANSLNSGVYFVRLIGKGINRNQKVILLK